MTAVIYARYSSDNQREESIEGQIRECTAYAEKNGITVIKHYIDRAFSAKTARSCLMLFSSGNLTALPGIVLIAQITR